MKNARTVALLIVIAALATSVPAQELEVVDAPRILELPNLDWQRVVDKAMAAYSGCSSYRDEGVVTDRMEAPDGVLEWEIRFTTAFRRPGEFRFEFKMNGTQYEPAVLWRGDDDVLLWKGNDADEYESLGPAVAEVMGVSSGCAHTIPSLLMPDQISGRSLRDFGDVRAVSIEKTGRATCYVFDGRLAGNPTKIWIDARSNLVRRLETKRRVGDIESSTSVVYNPRINVEVDDEDIAPRPPDMVVTPQG